MLDSAPSKSMRIQAPGIANNALTHKTNAVIPTNPRSPFTDVYPFFVYCNSDYNVDTFYCKRLFTF